MSVWACFQRFLISKVASRRATAFFLLRGHIAGHAAGHAAGMVALRAGSTDARERHARPGASSCIRATVAATLRIEPGRIECPRARLQGSIQPAILRLGRRDGLQVSADDPRDRCAPGKLAKRFGSDRGIAQRQARRSKGVEPRRNMEGRADSTVERNVAGRDEGRLAHQELTPYKRRPSIELAAADVKRKLIDAIAVIVVQGIDER